MSRKYTSLPYTEYTVASGHYDTSRVLPLNKIVLHSSASTKQGLIDTFAGGSRLVSAHYGIDNDGSILAFLEEYYTAYANGNYPVNQSSLSIEHIDNGSTVKLHTDAQYNTSIKLVADMCKFYSIPCDMSHVVPHSSIVATACPNGLDVNRIINGARVILGQVSITSITVDSTVYSMLVGKASKYDDFVKIGFSSAQDASTKVNDLTNRVNSLQSKIDAARKDLS